MISVILPCVNELRHGYLPQIVENLCGQGGEKEIIAVLSPSQDGTAEFLARCPAVRLVHTPAQNRAQRLNAGLAACRGEGVLLHHPATLLPEGTALTMIEQALRQEEVAWGGFCHSFDLDHWLLRFTSWYSTRVRSRLGQILYLDHCVFARRETLIAIGGVPDMDIFEDTALSQRLQAHGPPLLLPGTVVTSARRFRQRGLYRQAALNQILKLMYHAGASPAQMNRLYERTSQINVVYPVAPPPPTPRPKYK
ncbi:MAG: glycosyltransferase [Nodosilinea sp.]